MRDELLHQRVAKSPLERSLAEAEISWIFAQQGWEKIIRKKAAGNLICKSGARSKKAAQILVDNGFKQAIGISGGTDAWAAAGLPMAP